MPQIQSVLVVDDDILQLEVMRDYFARRHVTNVTCVSDGQIAANLLMTPGKEQPDLIVSDIHMPYLDGIEIIAIAGETCPQVPIILLSGSGRQQLDAAAVLATGSGLNVLAALSKPIDEDAIDLAISQFEGSAGLLEATV